jgi:hypothetical protein
MTARSCLVLGVLIVLLIGCTGAPKTVPVSGRVTLDKKPLANATLQFVPASGSATNTQPSALGTTDEDGRYSLVLNTSDNTKGAVAGKYKVMITLGAQPGADETKPTYHKQLPERYNRKTQLECDIPAEGRADADFNLTSQ